MKKIAIMTALILALAVPAFAQQPVQRGVLFQLGASAGVTMGTDLPTEASEFGRGFGVGLGYDFSKNPRGFGLTLEGKYNWLNIEGEEYSGFLILLSLCWK
jgi:opacity protein-like surface antigen